MEEAKYTMFGLPNKKKMFVMGLITFTNKAVMSMLVQGLDA